MRRAPNSLAGPKKVKRGVAGGKRAAPQVMRAVPQVKRAVPGSVPVPVKRAAPRTAGIHRTQASCQAEPAGLGFTGGFVVSACVRE